MPAFAVWTGGISGSFVVSASEKQKSRRVYAVYCYFRTGWHVVSHVWFTDNSDSASKRVFYYQMSKDHYSIGGAKSEPHMGTRQAVVGGRIKLSTMLG